MKYEAVDIAQWLRAVGAFAENQHMVPGPLSGGSQPAAPAGPVDLMSFLCSIHVNTGSYKTKEGQAPF